MTDPHRIERLRYRSWHRGTREMDLLLGSFADRNLAAFTPLQLDEYETILTENDPNLYNWITGADSLPSSLEGEVMRLLRFHSYAKQSA